MTIKNIWEEMSKICNSSGEDNKYKKTRLIELFSRPETFNYYMRLGEKTLGVFSKFTSDDAIGGLVRSVSTIGDDIENKYWDVLEDTIRTFNGTIKFSSYFTINFKRRLKDRDIISNIKERIITDSWDTPVSKDDEGDGLTIEETYNKISDDINEPEQNFAIKQHIDNLSTLFLLMKHIVSVKKWGKTAIRYRKIYEKMYTSDFCNFICKSYEITDYIGQNLLKHEKEIFSFMDLLFMNFFMAEESHNIREIAKNHTRTEKQTGISEKEERLNLPIEQRFFRFYYKTEEKMDEKDLDGMHHCFDKYRKTFEDINPKKFMNISKSEENTIKSYARRYIKGNYRNG